MTVLTSPVDSFSPGNESTTHYVQMTGDLRIDGKKVPSIRAAELLHLVAHNGNQMSRTEIEEKLYGGYCARSSLWYPLKVCQKSGIDIRYNRETKTVVLYDEIQFDYDSAMHFLSKGDLDAALWVLNGWPITNQTESYSDQLSDKFKQKLESLRSNYYWSEIEELFESLEYKCDRDISNRNTHYSCCIH